MRPAVGELLQGWSSGVLIDAKTVVDPNSVGIVRSNGQLEL